MNEDGERIQFIGDVVKGRKTPTDKKIRRKRNDAGKTLKIDCIEDVALTNDRKIRVTMA